MKFHRLVATGCAKEVGLRMGVEFYFLTGDPPS